MPKEPDRTLKVSASASMNAAPERVYATIANYHTGHPRILPKQFSGMVVDAGGVGAGTIVRFNMRVFGKTQVFRAAVTEPQPGRVLVETDLGFNGAVTTFTVDPGATPGQSEVTISTELRVRGGVVGAIEHYLTRRYLRPIYLEELMLLRAFVERQDSVERARE